MLTRLNHIAVVVPDLAAAAALYRDVFGARVSEPTDLPAHGVSTVFVHLDNTNIELLHPYGEDSPVAKFLRHNPNGAIHHMCCEVEDIQNAADRLTGHGLRALGEIKPGAHNKPVLFLHPKDTLGVLIELEQA